MTGNKRRRGRSHWPCARRAAASRVHQLAERAKALGWSAQQCLVIDDDLGLSGAQVSNRPGYQRLVSLVALRAVGTVFGPEVSRLARNCLDWYQLLELAGAFAVLIGDEDGLFDPSDFNDRLLLGLEGRLVRDRAVSDRSADAAGSTQQSATCQAWS